MGFSQGLSGLNSASQALDVVGNNIANSQTVGFKSGSISFADMFAGSAVGMGVQVAGINQNFGDGTIGMGTNPLDMAIQGNGFFRMIDTSGKVMYSRNGQFQQDENGYIINNQGMFLSGYQATGTPPVIQPGAPVGPIQIPTGQMPARASDAGTMAGNLDSGETEIDIANHKFDVTDKDSYNSVSQVDAYDSLGNKHTINVYFVKEGPNRWSAHSVDSSVPGSSSQAVTLEFDGNGNLQPTSANKLNVSSASYNGADALNFDLDMSAMMQQASETSMQSPSTTGYPPGMMNGYTVGDGGEIVASYSNGEQQLIGQVVLSNFTNPGGLQSMGNNCWSETPQSGQPVVGSSGSGNLGKIFGGKVEASNVDLSQEMVNMIVYQRNYQSNAQTIKTQSEVLQTLVNLG